MVIRELKAKDVKTLAHILGKLKPASIGDLFNVLDKKKGDNLMAVGMSIFRIVAADLTDDIYEWLADLIGKPIEELDDMPFNTPADIIKELMNRGQFKDFFDLASRQAGKAPPKSTTSFNPVTIGRTEK